MIECKILILLESARVFAQTRKLTGFPSPRFRIRMHSGEFVPEFAAVA
jgi:hypothetical protein